MPFFLLFFCVFTIKHMNSGICQKKKKKQCNVTVLLGRCTFTLLGSIVDKVETKCKKSKR